jgi:hypothetical protein
MTFDRFPDAPPSIRALARDDRGFPVPFFVEYIDGKPDFRVMDPEKMVRCIRHGLCWICGKALGRMKAFAIGPMCSVNRISAEPPAHPMCATFAAKACPFLSHPLAKRPPVDDLAERFGQPAPAGGVMLEHNPGVTLIWHCLRYSLNRQADGILFEIGPPSRCAWFREGREATRQEILDSFDLGLPILREMAEEEGPHAVHELEQRLHRAMQLVPK